MCSATDCHKAVFRRGLCSMHYSRLLRYGDLNYTKTVPNGTVPLWIEDHASFDGDGCLIWPFGRFANGYGAVSSDPRGRVASRVMCWRVNGAPPSDKHEAAHSCGNGHRGCVHPKHLSWATAVENDTDKDAHGTRNDGARNGSAKLTETDVDYVIGALNRGISQQALANWLGVSRTTIGRIARGDSWRTVQSNYRAMAKVA